MLSDFKDADTFKQKKIYCIGISQSLNTFVIFQLSSDTGIFSK